MKKHRQPKRTAFLLANLACFLSFAGHSQAVLRGAVLLSPNSPAANANISLLSSGDSSLIKAGLCNKDGGYVFTNVGKKKFKERRERTTGAEKEKRRL